MQFVYTPEGAQPKRWDFEPGKLMNAEAEAIERYTKMTFGEWQEKVQRGSVTALRGLLFVMLKRENPTLRYDQVEFAVDELDFTLSDDETRDACAALEQRLSNGEELDPSELMLLEMFRESPAVKGAATEAADDEREVVAAHPEG